MALPARVANSRTGGSIWVGLVTMHLSTLVGDLEPRSGTMFRKRFSVIITIVLLVGLVLTFLTGFLAAALDLNRFAIHKYAAYVVIALSAMHVMLHWRSLTGQIRRWFSRLPAPRPRQIASPDATRAPTPRYPRRAFFLPAFTLAAGAALGSAWTTRTRPSALEAGDDLGQVYHQWSKPTYAGLLTKSLHVSPPPSPYKDYPAAPQIALPAVPAPGGPPLEVVIAHRRSVREYALRPVSQSELSRLLQSSFGITDRSDPTLAFRAAPSSGALYPIDLYPVIFNVEGLASGVYHYQVREHRLAFLRPGDFRQTVFQAVLLQEMVLQAALVLVLTAVFPRVQGKYLDRSYRYALLEAGHVGQNVYLSATALGLGPCGIGAFYDDDLNGLLGVDGHDEATVYVLAIGARDPAGPAMTS